MNKKYTDEVFKFFTEDEERFLMMGKIAQHEPNVKRELIQGFWEELKVILKTEFEGKNEDWEVKFSDDFSIFYNKILLCRKEWPRDHNEYPLVSIAIESLFWGNQPFIGVLVIYTNDSYETEGIKELIRRAEQFSDLGIEKKNKWYPVMRDTSLSLVDYERLVDILPAKKSKTIESLILETRRYTEALDGFMKANNYLRAYRKEK